MANAPEPPWYRQVTREQWKAFLATFFGWMLDGFDFTILTFILIDIQNSFTVDRALAGALGTVTLMFRLVGGFSFGVMADRYGRKLPLMLSILWFSLFAFLSGFSTSYAMLFAFRALFGVGMGGEWAAGMPLALEHWPTRFRGLASGLLQGGFYWGYILSALTFHYVYPLFNATPDPFSDAAGATLGWRVMFWTGVIPALLVLWIRSGVSESPVWLARQQRLRDAGSAAVAEHVSVLRLFQPDLWWATVQSSLLMGAFMFSYYSLSFWYPTFLREAGLDTLGYLIAFNLGAIVGMALWGRASETRLGVCARHRRHRHGRLRRRCLGHGAVVSDRAVSDRGARCRARPVLPSRCRAWLRDSVRARSTPGWRHDGRRRHEPLHRGVWIARGHRGLDGTGNARASVH
jgi:SHS family lactate transporter-like MFS transporter